MSQSAVQAAVARASEKRQKKKRRARDLAYSAESKLPSVAASVPKNVGAAIVSRSPPREPGSLSDSETNGRQNRLLRSLSLMHRQPTTPLAMHCISGTNSPRQQTTDESPREKAATPGLLESVATTLSRSMPNVRALEAVVATTASSAATSAEKALASTLSPRPPTSAASSKRASTELRTAQQQQQTVLFISSTISTLDDNDGDVEQDDCDLAPDSDNEERVALSTLMLSRSATVPGSSADEFRARVPQNSLMRRMRRMTIGDRASDSSTTSDSSSSLRSESDERSSGGRSVAGQTTSSSPSGSSSTSNSSGSGAIQPARDETASAPAQASNGAPMLALGSPRRKSMQLLKTVFAPLLNGQQPPQPAATVPAVSPHSSPRGSPRELQPLPVSGPLERVHSYSHSSDLSRVKTPRQVLVDAFKRQKRVNKGWTLIVFNPNPVFGEKGVKQYLVPNSAIDNNMRFSLLRAMKSCGEDPFRLCACGNVTALDGTKSTYCTLHPEPDRAAKFPVLIMLDATFISRMAADATSLLKEFTVEHPSLVPGEWKEHAVDSERDDFSDVHLTHVYRVRTVV